LDRGGVLLAQFDKVFKLCGAAVESVGVPRDDGVDFVVGDGLKHLLVLRPRLSRVGRNVIVDVDAGDFPMEFLGKLSAVLFLAIDA
jgi:hypothetical protein